MNKSKDNRRMLRLLSFIILLPATIFLWLIGWTLYCMGGQRMASKDGHKRIVSSMGNEYEDHPKKLSPQILK